MPNVTTSYCDNCDKEMKKDEKHLIYKISFWDESKLEENTVDFINSTVGGCALMLCSEKCIGEYIINLLKNRKGENNGL